MDNNYYYNQQFQSQQAPNQAPKQDPPKQEPEKKGSKVWFKILISCCMGLLFGVFGGLGFMAVQKTTGMVNNSQPVNIESSANAQDSLGAVINEGSSSGVSDNQSSSNSVLNAITSSNLERQTSDVTTIAEALMPAMVSVKKEYKYEFGNDIYSYYFGGGSTSQVAEASGSGFIIAETDTEYLIVSNNHVVEDPISLEVTFVDGSTASAYIKGCDKTMDVAVIAVQKEDVEDSTKNEIKIAAIGDSESVRLGEQVVAIGNALGYGQSVTTGIVSAVNREVSMEDGSTGVFIQTDAAISPGNSGGALINMSGEVIGINSSKIGGSVVEGMGYAIPISSVTDIISDFMDQHTRIPIDEEEQGYIGISLQEVTQSLSNRFGIPVGIYVVEVQEGGGAYKAGLQVGDIITKFEGDTITSYQDLENVLQYYPKGATVKIEYMRQENGEYVSHTVDLTLGDKPTKTQ